MDITSYLLSKQYTDSKVKEAMNGDYLPLSGGVLTGNLIIGSIHSANNAQLRIAKKGSDDLGYQMGGYISNGNYGRLDYIANSSIANFLQLSDTETGFGKPVRVSSGGTGVTSYEELKQKLGILNIEEIKNLITETLNNFPKAEEGTF